MAEESFVLTQQVFKASHPPIRVDVYHENNLTQSALEAFLETTAGGVIGAAPAYGSKCVLGILALSSAAHVLVIRISSSKVGNNSQKGRKKTAHTGHDLLRDLILCDSKRTKYAFQMDKLATALHFDLGRRINQAVDLLSARKTSTDRHSLAALLEVLGGELSLNKVQVSTLFKDEENLSTPIRAVATQAWAAYQAAHLDCMSKRLGGIAKIHTDVIIKAHLDVLAKTVRDADRLTALKPTRVRNEVDLEFSRNKGNVELMSNRFKTRIMRTAAHQVIEIQANCKGKVTTSVGQSKRVKGRAATIALKGPLPEGNIRSVTTIGREALTSAESMREGVILKSLQQTSTVMKTPFVQGIFLPHNKPNWVDTPTLLPPVSLYFPSDRTLNPSQANAVSTILSNNNADRIALIHGPPGTGKTTVIAAAVTSVMAPISRDRTLWLVAQSNVAVKNIAEKLATVDFLDFKILVSKDFHFDWHEHLYEKIKKNLIRSDDFIPDPVATERLLLGSRVILCTLSMLSNHRLGTIMRLVPPQTIIFDEASQIEIGDYFPLFYRFQPTLQKLVFIGDDKQLAPYGQSDVKDLRSIFEIPHLRERAVFLDTQYRMPIPIGNFISRKVYDNQLKSEHPIQAPSSCVFVNIAKGKEEKKGHSWMNAREVSTALALAKKFNKYGKRYRIITAYDAQRSQLENALKSAELPWEDRCFNIDSFQGNEEDYIILSLVRSDKLGFMKENRRMNVMLTRCKKGMIILTSRAFIETKAPSSLVGALAKTLGPKAWLELGHVLSSNFHPFSI